MTTNTDIKKCLICNTSSHLRPQSPQSTQRLSHQLLSVFLLRNVFELPSWTLQKYLVNTLGANPSQWFAICQQCDLHVRQIKALHDQVLKANRRFLEAKHKLVKRVKQSKENQRLSQVSNRPSFTDECREFVEIYDYGQLLDTRSSSELDLVNFGGGRDNAPTMPEDDDGVNVKTEILDEIPDEPEIDDYFDDLLEEGYDYDDYDQAEDEDNDAPDSDPDDDDYPPPPSPPKRRKCPTTAFNHEIEFAEAKDHVQFLETNQGNKMVQYEGQNYYYQHHRRISKSVTPDNNVAQFYCVRRRRGGCGAKIGLRNFNPEDSNFTSLIPSVIEHNHDHDDSTTGKKIKALAKEIVKANLEMSVPQVVEMVKENFAGDPEAVQELSKANVLNNLKKMIVYMKRKMGWKPEAASSTSTPRRRERKTESAIVEVEVGFAEVGSSLQFLLTSQGKRMVRYEGHNYYYNNGRHRDGDVTYFDCMMRRTKHCAARVGLRNYEDGDCSYTSLIPNPQPHEHNSTKKSSVMYEVTALTKELVKDNVDMSTTRILQMVQDSFINDPEAVQELDKPNIQNNLKRLVAHTKKKLGWKPPEDSVRPRRDRKAEEVVELGFIEASSSLQFLFTTHGKRMVRYEGHNFYFNGGRFRTGDVTYFYCMKRRTKHCNARVGLRNYKDDDCSFTSFIPSSDAHNHDDSTKNSVMYEVNALARQIVQDNVDMSITRVFQMVQDSFISDPEATEELAKVNVQNSLRKLIGNTKKRLGWKPEVDVGGKQRKGTGVAGRRKRKRGAKSAESVGGSTEVIIDKPANLNSFIDQMLQ